MSTPTRAFKGVWIPVEIWDSTELSWMEKCLLAEINSLDNGTGCYAGNEFLAERFKTTAGNIAKIICELRSKKFIEDVAFDGRTRWIRVAVPITKPTNQPLRFGKGRVSGGVNPDGPCCIEEKLKRDSLCESLPINPPSADKKTNPLEDPNSKESLALALYKSYPRKVGKNAALKAILKAMKDHPFDYLLERTAKYAEYTRAWPEDQLCYIPYPQKWFNECRFENDEREWIKTGRTASSPIAQRISIEKQIESIIEQIKEHPGNPEWIGYDQNKVKQQDRDDLQLVRKRLAELRKKQNTIT